MGKILITGANRGIGLGFVKEYLKKGWDVFACCRNPSRASELASLQKEHHQLLQIFSLDVNDPNQIESLAHRLKEHTIDILINNAGVYGPHGMQLGRLNQGVWLDVFKTNTISPLLMAQAFIPHIQRSKKGIIANISSTMGSIAENTNGDAYIYRSSKSAMNAALKSLSIDIKNKNICVVILHPGWVKTEMGGPDAKIEVNESVTGMSKILEKITLNDSGKFIAYDGREVAW